MQKIVEIIRVPFNFLNSGIYAVGITQVSYYQDFHSSFNNNIFNNNSW